VVVVNRKTPAKPRYIVLASTDLALDGRKLVELYGARFQIEFPHSIGFSGRQRSLDCQRRLPLYFPCAPSSQLRNLSENNLNNIGNLKIYH
jgi:hypothetical protein